MRLASRILMAFAFMALAVGSALAQVEKVGPAAGSSAELMIPTSEELKAESVDDVARIMAAKAPKESFSDLRAIGVGLVIIGAGVGIGWLTRAAVEGMARQPETADRIQTAMIISAALIEGVTFFALIVIGFILSQY